MQKQHHDLPLRIGVGIVLVNKDNKVFVAKRIDNPKEYWQMPQGGVDKNENFFKAALRELREETSITSVSLIKEIEGYTTYNLPKNLLGIIWRGKFKGQKQKWYVLRFNGDDSEIDINTFKPEFLSWKWIKIDDLTDVVVDFKFKVYEKIKLELKKILLV